MNDKFITIFGIIVVAVILNSIAQFLIVWNLNKIRRLFKEEFPNKTDLLVLLMSDLIPKGTPLKDRIFKSSQIAEKRLMEILSNENSIQFDQSKYAPSIRKICRLHTFYSFVLYTAILLVILISIFLNA